MIHVTISEPGKEMDKKTIWKQEIQDKYESDNESDFNYSYNTEMEKPDDLTVTVVPSNDIGTVPAM